MALVEQPAEFRFPSYQADSNQTDGPNGGDSSGGGDASGAGGNSGGSQSHRAAVEREFQAAMQFYSAGGSGAAAAAAPPAAPAALLPADYVPPDERLRLCQEPLILYKRPPPPQQPQKQQQPVAAAASATGGRRSSKDGSSQTDLPLPLPAWSPRPTPFAALASAAPPTNEAAIQQRGHLWRSRSSTDLSDAAAAEPAGSGAGLHRPRTPPASILRRPVSAAAAAGARPAQRGPVWGGASAADAEELPVQQFYDLTQLQRSNLRPNDELAPDPTKAYMGRHFIDRPFPAEHPFASHQPRKALFPQFVGPPPPGSAPLPSGAPAGPEPLELKDRAASGAQRHELFHLGGPPRHLAWPGDNFDQVPKLSRRHPQPVYYPVPPQLLGANIPSTAAAAAANPEAADTLRNIERDQWRSQYARSFTGAGEEFPVALTNWREKQLQTVHGLPVDNSLKPRAQRPLEPPRPQEGRIARQLVPRSAGRPPLPTGRSSRPETDREREERWLLEGREYRNLPDNWDALMQQQMWRAASQASSRSASPSPQRQEQEQQDAANATDAAAPGVGRPVADEALVQRQPWGQKLEDRYQAYRSSVERLHPRPQQQHAPPAVASSSDALSGIEWLRRQYQPAGPQPRPGPLAAPEGPQLTSTLGLPGTAIGPTPAAPAPTAAAATAREREREQPGQRHYQLHQEPPPEDDAWERSRAPQRRRHQSQPPQQQSKGVNFDTDVMVAYGYGSEPVVLSQEHLREAANNNSEFPQLPMMPLPPPPPLLASYHGGGSSVDDGDILRHLRGDFSRSSVRRDFRHRFAEEPPSSAGGGGVDLRDATRRGRRHVFYGVNGQLLHG